jgi:hypothetical protein
VTTDARDRLRHRQSEVLAAVMAGQVPEGFDEASTRVTGVVLRAKRRRAALRALPWLAGLPDVAGHFDRFAREHPPAGCGHDDGDAFAAWAEGRGLLDRFALSAWRVRQVDLGVRRTALQLGPGTRPVLVLGVGPYVYEVPLPAPREPQERPDRRG